jgi:hypothetical protein
VVGLGRTLDPITQDVCAFYEDHAVFDDYTGVVLDLEEGKRIAHALGDNKAAILRNHGLLTVGHSVDEAVWWFITMERSCQAQLLASSAGTPVLIDPDMARLTQPGRLPPGRLVQLPAPVRAHRARAARPPRLTPNRDGRSAAGSARSGLGPGPLRGDDHHRDLPRRVALVDVVPAAHPRVEEGPSPGWSG